MAIDAYYSPRNTLFAHHEEISRQSHLHQLVKDMSEKAMSTITRSLPGKTYTALLFKQVAFTAQILQLLPGPFEEPIVQQLPPVRPVVLRPTSTASYPCLHDQVR